MIPFIDLYTQYLTLKDEIDYVIEDVIKRSLFIGGEYVDKFEEMYANYMDSKHCISCANGTDSLYLAMKALGLRSGEEVIVPAHSWISTAETVTQANGKVVFCDTTIDTFTIDVDQIESKITKNTVGIIPVHLYGQAADMDRIMAIANKYNLWVIEDCAQAHLAKFKERKVGTFGIAASYSFYPGKNIGAMGDAGAVVTNDFALAKKIRMLARHGGLKKGDHQIEGFNSRLDGMQAAILTVKLPHLERWTKLRQKNAEIYSGLLYDASDVTTPYVKKENEHVWHLYVIKHPRRSDLSAYLNKCGIESSIHYPLALPFLPAYQHYEHSPIDFPNAYLNQNSILSLPMYPELKHEQIIEITSRVSDFCKL